MKNIEVSSSYPLKSAMTDLYLDETLLLCVDPQDRRAFTINIGSESCSDLDSEECTKAINSKIARQEFVMRELLDEIGEKKGERVSQWAIWDSKVSE